MSDEATPPPTTKTILVTGGCGYIGSHTLVVLLTSTETIYNVVVVDNLCNSSASCLDRVASICNLSETDRRTRLIFHEVDLCDESALEQVMKSSPTFDGCIHFAGLKAVGESARKPLLYYDNNLRSTLVLLKLLDEYGCRSIVFSSSATVYGEPDVMPMTEQTPVGVGITNAYGRTKYMIEEILGDFHKSKELAMAEGGGGEKRKREDGDDDRPWSVAILRYFNPVGAHPSGQIGEDPNGIPNNLMPYVAQVAIGRREFLTVYGNDYDTPDGTGVRDYLHVMDLAEGHLSALRYMQKDDAGGKGYGKNSVFNLGTGSGSSVLDMVKAMEGACGKKIPYKIGPRRPGDVTVYYADASLAKTEMGWEATLGLDEMCKDLWNWQTKNPNGYNGGESNN